MPITVLTSYSASPVGNTGSVFLAKPDGTRRAVSLPAGCNITATKGTVAVDNDRLYLVGWATDNLLVDPHYRLLRQGIRPPHQVPVLSASPGPGTSGKMRVAVAFYDETGDEWSPLSGPSNEIDLVNGSRTTSNIQTTSLDSPRVSHVGVFVSFEGQEFKEAVRRQLGVSSVTENVPVLALGDFHFGTFERLPRGSVNAIYHKRQVVAGVFGNEDWIYLSAVGFPERWEGLRLRTKNGDKPLALLPSSVTDDTLLVVCAQSTYALRGYTDADMEITRVSDRVGIYNNRAWAIIHGNPWVCNQMGIFMWAGGWHQMNKDRDHEWVRTIQAFPNVPRDVFMADNPADRCVQVYLGPNAAVEIPAEYTTRGTVRWSGSYRDSQPELSGGYAQPHWTTDIMARKIEAVGLVALPGGSQQFQLLGVCTDFFVRTPDPNDDNDDGDAMQKRAWLRLGHNVLGDPGGGEFEGKEYHRVFSYVESERQEWKIRVLGGDEQVWRQIPPDNVNYFWERTVPASLATGDVGSNVVQFLPQTVHEHEPTSVHGRGITAEWTVQTPLGFRWRGWGGAFRPSSQPSRGVELQIK